MVYQGKPSAGCANCRKRKIKCDEVKPACSQCVNTKRQCPGYIARFDLVLRDQTKAVRRKAQQRKQSTDVSQVQRTSGPGQISPVSDDSTPGTSSFALIGTGSRRVVAKRSNSADDTLPRVFNDFPEEQAICGFFLDFVLLPRHPDTIQGHLEHLLPLYQKTSPGSPLSLATSAVALLISGDSPLRRADQQLGRNIFGKALQKTSVAIRDPVESLKDETLMAVLLLGLFERISAIGDTAKSNMTSTHNAGAAALVRHRGAKNCESPLAIGLVFAVRTQLVGHAIDNSVAFRRCPDQLSNIFKALPQNAASRLTSATINIADLRSCAKSALQLPHTPASEKEINDLLEYAISIDLLVGVWPDSLPDNWMWTQSDAFDLPPPPMPKSAFVYESTQPAISPGLQTPPPRTPDVYLDLWVLSIWNQYRAARIKIQRIILDCIAYLGPAYDAQWYWRAVYASMVTQEMVDDIAHSVPFALGTKMFGGPGERDGVEFPYVAARGKQSVEHSRAAAAMGGWHLIDPLKACVLDSGAYLRDGQPEWLASQMERIGRIYGLHGQRSSGTMAADTPIFTAPVAPPKAGSGFDWPAADPPAYASASASASTEPRRASEGSIPRPPQTHTHTHTHATLPQQQVSMDGEVWNRHSWEFPV